MSAYRPTLDDLSARGADQFIGWMGNAARHSRHIRQQIEAFLKHEAKCVAEDSSRDTFTHSAVAKMRGEAEICRACSLPIADCGCIGKTIRGAIAEAVLREVAP